MFPRPLGSHRERITTPGCAEQVNLLALDAYERMSGLDLEDVTVDGCITKASSDGEAAGRSPVDRGKQVLKRSSLSPVVIEPREG